jgi:hypothetical protein
LRIAECHSCWHWDNMNLDAVELRITFIDHFIILGLKYPLPQASHSPHHSTSTMTADETESGALGVGR